MLRAAVVLTLTLLGACAFEPPARQAEPAHENDPAHIERFELKGRIGLRGSGSASLNWKQARDYYRIVLLGPFGSGRIEIEGDARQAVWRDKDGNFASTRHPESFLREKLGWTLPIKPLRFWIRGLASPDDPIEQFNLEQGRLRVLRQNGWLLRIERYQNVEGFELPGKLVLEQQTQHLTLLISEWTVYQ